MHHTTPHHIIYMCTHVFNNLQSDSCVRYHYTTAGSILSPGYPLGYPANANCTDVITLAQGSQLSLESVYHHTEYRPHCDYDNVTVKYLIITPRGVISETITGFMTDNTLMMLVVISPSKHTVISHLVHQCIIYCMVVRTREDSPSL